MLLRSVSKNFKEFESLMEVAKQSWNLLICFLSAYIKNWNKRNLAAFNRYIQKQLSINILSRDTNALRINEECIAQVSEKLRAD